MWNLKAQVLVFTAAAVFAVGSVWYAHSSGRQSGMQEIQSLRDSEKKDIAEAISQELMRVRERERQLLAHAAKIREESKREQARMAAEHQRTLDGLRDRPEARAADSGGVPEGAIAGVGCTGAGLARLDAQLLAGYAHRAAELQLAYGECKAKYDALTR